MRKILPLLVLLGACARASAPAEKNLGPPEPEAMLEQEGGCGCAGEREAYFEDARSESLDRDDAGRPKKSDKKKSRTWKRSQLTPHTSQLRIGDKETLPLRAVQATVDVQGFRARVVLDFLYENKEAADYEGNFMVRLPNEAAPYYFAFGKAKRERVLFSKTQVSGHGTDVTEIREAREQAWTGPREARMVPKRKAAHAYGEIVRRNIDPALLEWAGAGVFRARVFPLSGRTLHRIVLAYDVNLTPVGDRLEYRLDLPAGIPNLAVDIRAEVGGGSWRDPDRRSFRVSTAAPGAVLLKGDAYFAAFARPELPKRRARPVSRAVFLLDTSLSQNPERFNVWLRLLEEILDRNRDTLREFAVLFFNVEATWWRKDMTPNTKAHAKALLRDARKLVLEGATDLGLAIETAAERFGDLFLLGDGSGTWGEADPHALARRLPEGRSLFAYNTGFSGTDTKTMSFLARESGGAVFTVTGEDEVADAAVAHTFRPWVLKGVEMDGGRDVLLAGRPRTLFPGQTLYAAGRGQPEGPLRLRLEDRTLDVPIARTQRSDLAAGVFGHIAVGQLEELEITEAARPFAQHFRVVGKTCSLLMLESEEDYKEFGIVPEDDAKTVRKVQVDALVRETLASIGDSLSNPKKRFLSWLDSLADMPIEFAFPKEARARLEALPVEAFLVVPERLRCEVRRWDQIPGRIHEELASRKLTYDSMTQEAQRRVAPADRLKALSSLVENRPGDLTLQRDIGYTALSWGLGGQAYWLFRRAAEARPYEPHGYHAMALCLQKMGKTDLAAAYYEIALAGEWPSRYGDFERIVAVDCGRAKLRPTDLIVTIAWNTDRTDVDLHVIDPNKEECYYSHKRTKIGGEITDDVTTGFGPEMFVLPRAIPGTYQIKVKYFSQDRARASTRTKVYVTVYEDWGRPNQRTTRKVVTLAYGQKMHTVANVKR